MNKLQSFHFSLPILHFLIYIYIYSTGVSRGSNTPVAYIEPTWSYPDLKRGIESNLR